jgi:RHS repeat-associated protein
LHVPLAGRTIAKYAGAGSPYFMHPNHLGSTTAVTNQTGNLIEGQLFYPWGQLWTYAQGLHDMRFASMGVREWFVSGEADQVMDFTLFRTYQPRLGRWLSPDPIAGDILNPQSLNCYGYVLNNPTNLIDPLGLSCSDVEGSDPNFTMSCGAGTPDIPTIPSSLPGLIPPGGYSGGSDLTGQRFEVFLASIPPGQCATLYEGRMAMQTFCNMPQSNLSEPSFTMTSGASGSGFSEAVDSAYDAALAKAGAYFRGRPPGQSFGACVGENLSLTLTGSTKHVIATTVIASAAGTASLASALFRKDSMELAAYLTIVAGAYIAPAAGASAIAAVGRTAADITLGVGAASFGLFIGSAANCASQGVNP